MGRVLIFGLASAAVSIAAVFAGCSSDEKTATPTEAGTQPVSDAGFDVKSSCGHPGDQGNSLGVGLFCVNISDCENNTKAKLCTTFGDPENFFCTFRCDKDAGDGVCGENARCACNASGTACGCYPTRCDEPDDGGGDANSLDGARDAANTDASDASDDAPGDASGQ